ncbi:MAG TPA: protein kinase [Pirellulales bacterium]|nr:protein kinase [Pirellulales bacterium]
MPDILKCPGCGVEIPAGSPAGLCPQCLLKAGLGSQSGIDPKTRPTEPPRSSFGDFVPPTPEQLSARFPLLDFLELLGKGGMGAVYKARQRGLNRIVAVKILPPEVGRDPAFADRFTREAHALAHLNHPNIVTVYDFGQVDGLYYLVMEFVDGVNLRQAIQSHLSSKETLAIVPQICDALQFAHDEGVVHRDIKPENILIDKRGRVKIADFGLAKLLRQEQAVQALTATNQVMGTLRYMAPEQMEGAHDVDHRADIYSLGVVFYELLTGHLPMGRFEPPSKSVHVDVRLDEVVLRALEREPQRRYQNASEVRIDLDKISGVAPLAIQRAFGKEFRSKATLFGLPLVHVAYGLDPATGRNRVAKGIFAFGNMAVGVFAFGGLAVGGVAFGGMSLGLLTLGGVTVGLLGAFGGLALGGFAWGGLGVGIVAMGGLACGYYAFGGTAFGVHAMGGNGQDPAAKSFFEPWAYHWPYWMTAMSIIVTLVYLLLFLVVWLIMRREEGKRRRLAANTADSSVRSRL